MTSLTNQVQLPLPICSFEGLEFFYDSSRSDLAHYGIARHDADQLHLTWRDLVGICVEYLRVGGSVGMKLAEVLSEDHPAPKVYLKGVTGRSSKIMRETRENLSKECDPAMNVPLTWGPLSISKVSENNYSIPEALTLDDCVALAAIVLSHPLTAASFPDQYCPFLFKFLAANKGSVVTLVPAKSETETVELLPQVSVVSRAYEDLLLPPLGAVLDVDQLRSAMMSAIPPEIREALGL